MTIDELINKLQSVKVELKNTAHDVEDTIQIQILGDFNSDSDFDIEDVTFGLRIGCLCPEFAIIQLKVLND